MFARIWEILKQNPNDFDRQMPGVCIINTGILFALPGYQRAKHSLTDKQGESVDLKMQSVTIQTCRKESKNFE